MVKERNMAPSGKTWKIGFILLAFWISIGLLTSEVSAAPQKDTEYDFWQNMGERAAKESLKKMKAKGIKPNRGNLIIMSNAG
jgi:hypothetical protein